MVMSGRPGDWFIRGLWSEGLWEINIMVIDSSYYRWIDGGVSHHHRDRV